MKNLLSSMHIKLILNKIYLYYFICICLFYAGITGCNYSKTKVQKKTMDSVSTFNFNDSTPNSQKCMQYDSLSWKKLMKKLLLSSSLPDHILTLIRNNQASMIQIETVDTTVVLIQVYIGSDYNRATLNNIEIDPFKKLLLDVSEDIESPVVLKCDSNVLNFIIEKYYKY